MEYPILDETLDMTIKNLGPCQIETPIKDVTYFHDLYRIVYNIQEFNVARHISDGTLPRSVEVGGPRRKIYFDPDKVGVAIVTCGGLCPGLNNVIRDLTMCLHYNYGVGNILGIRYGYQGLVEDYHHDPILLTPELVDDFHTKGGTFLSSSRGNQSAEKIVDFLQKRNISILFTIGGDGTLKGAHSIHQEIERRGCRIAVVGIPKTIDNDICFISRTFGFDSAVAIAKDAVHAAHTEAKGALNGIGLVKLMGRDSGFIAVSAALASNEANYVLIPEMDFDMEGENGLLNNLKHRILARQHALIIVAEGAGQNYVQSSGFDASGNKKLGDIGLFLKKQIESYFVDQDIPVVIKYIDPSYMIRSVPANSNDSIFCTNLAHTAVHAAMAGKTDLCVGLLYDTLIHLPIPLVVQNRKKVDLKSLLWQNVLMSTGMRSMKN